MRARGRAAARVDSSASISRIPTATAEAWEGGYFHTGDVVQADADGDFHFIDRKKNVIRRSGENISAVEVEGVMLQHPRVAAAGVAAVPDEVRGDEVMACIVPREPVSAAEPADLAPRRIRVLHAAARVLQGAGLRGVRSSSCR